jgi:hypothetical protein
MNVIGNAADGSTTGLKIHTSRSGDGKGRCRIPRRKNTLEVRLNSFFDPQSFQSRTLSHPMRNIQAVPRCGHGRMALAGGVIFSWF